MKVVLNQAECVAIFCIAVLIVYVSPFFVFRSPKDWDFIFIWDDRSNFVENDVLQSSFSLDTIYAMLTMIRINVYEPLAWILKFAVTKLVGLDSWWVRLVSVIVHVGAGMVLAKAAAVLLDIDYLLAKLNRSGGVQTDMQQLQSWSNRHFPACCLSAVLFLIHPIHVEVIAWPSAQSYTLAALFSNLAILVHVQDIDKKLLKAVTENAKRDEAKDFEVLFGDGITRSKLLSSGLYLCALLSKSASILLPASFILVDMLVFMQISQRQGNFSARQFGLYGIGALPSIVICLTFLLVTLSSNVEGKVPDLVFLSTSERAIKAVTTPVWVLRHMLWPSKLRPHFQLRPGDLSVESPECLLSLVLTAGVVGITILNLWCRGLSKHMLSLAFFVGMLVPVSGVVQHGMITAGGNRYAYLASIIVVPYGGWAIARWVLSNGNPDDGKLSLLDSQTEPEQEVPHHNNILPSRSLRNYARVAWILLTGMLLSISTQLIGHWRNESTLYEYSLRVDPADWKILGHRAEYLVHTKRCIEDNTECRHMWTLAYEFSPGGTLKSDLFRLHLLVALGRTDRACKGYFALLKHHPTSGSVHNNVAVCLVSHGELDEARKEFAMALRHRESEFTDSTHVANAQAFAKWEALHLRELDVPDYVGKLTY